MNIFYDTNEKANTDGCSCDACKVNPELAKWDTLVIPTKPGKGHDWAYTVHMPDASIQAFIAHSRRKGLVGPLPAQY
jgi:hypothetical protein